MATLTLRILTNSGDITKGSTLSSSEMDQNLIALNNQKFEKSGDTITGNATFSGAGLRILGDFTNATHNNRLAFQSTTINGNTSIGCIPNGTSTTTNINLWNATDLTNAQYCQLAALSSEGRLTVGYVGTNSYLPMTLYTGGAERVRIDTSGNVGVGINSPSTFGKFAVAGTASGTIVTQVAASGTIASPSATHIVGAAYVNGLTPVGIFSYNSFTDNYGHWLAFRTTDNANTTADRVVIGPSGNVGVGAIPSTKIHVYGANTASPDFANGDGVGATVYLQDTGGAGFNGGQLLFGALQGSFAGIKGELNNGTGPAGSLLFQTRGTSGNIIARMRIDTSGNVVPTSTNAYDLGTTSLRWRNIYTQDLHLSNGIGDYTVVEGLENLYLVNNKTNKSFKFALIEVDPTEVPEKSKVSDGS